MRFCDSSAQNRCRLRLSNGPHAQAAKDRRRDRAVPVMALFSFVALASALVLAFSFG
jgi:hypothetical protein